MPYWIRCKDNAHYLVSLTKGRLYKVLEDEDKHGFIRIIDDSGEDYLYPIILFEEV